MAPLEKSLRKQASKQASKPDRRRAERGPVAGAGRNPMTRADGVVSTPARESGSGTCHPLLPGLPDPAIPPHRLLSANLLDLVRARYHEPADSHDACLDDHSSDIQHRHTHSPWTFSGGAPRTRRSALPGATCAAVPGGPDRNRGGGYISPPISLISDTPRNP